MKQAEPGEFFICLIFVGKFLTIKFNFFNRYEYRAIQAVYFFLKWALLICVFQFVYLKMLIVLSSYFNIAQSCSDILSFILEISILCLLSFFFISSARVLQFYWPFKTLGFGFIYFLFQCFLLLFSLLLLLLFWVYFALFFLISKVEDYISVILIRSFLM